MDRSTVTALIKAKGGKIRMRKPTYTAYMIPLAEAKFLELRATIPFVSVWHTQGGTQLLTVHFDKAHNEDTADGMFTPLIGLPKRELALIVARQLFRQMPSATNLSVKRWAGMPRGALLDLARMALKAAEAGAYYDSEHDALRNGAEGPGTPYQWRGGRRHYDD